MQNVKNINGGWVLPGNSQLTSFRRQQERGVIIFWVSILPSVKLKRLQN